MMTIDEMEKFMRGLTSKEADAALNRFIKQFPPDTKEEMIRVSRDEAIADMLDEVWVPDVQMAVDLEILT